MTKYTNGNEYVTALNNKDYIGNYNIGPDGSYYTGKTYIYGESKILKLKVIEEEESPQIFEYNELNTKYSNQDFLSLISYYPTLSDKDYEQKIIKRYFARKANDKSSAIIEIDEKQYKKNNKYYAYVLLDWKIAGIDISDYNYKQVEEANEKMAGIKLVLANLTELSIRKKDNII